MLYHSDGDVNNYKNYVLNNAKFQFRLNELGMGGDVIVG